MSSAGVSGPRLVAVVAMAMALGLAVLFAPAAGAAQETHGEARFEESFALHGSHGFELAVLADDHDELLIEVTKRVGPHGRLEVGYTTAVPKWKGDGIDAKIGGLGRVDLEFVAESTHSFRGLKGCTGGSGTTERGHFVGRFVFHGERGYTRASAGSIAGKVTRVSASSCPVDGPAAGALERSTEQIEETETRLSSASRHANEGFEASTPQSYGEGLVPRSGYRAYVGGGEHGVYWFSEATVEVSSPAGFKIVGGAEPPEAAMVRPPAPFTGSASFRLLSPKRDEWTGDLGVMLPNVGFVHLAGPGHWAAICGASKCTDTFPPGTLSEEEVEEGS